MNQLSRVFAAVDFSMPARAAFDRALAISRTHEAELTVVHAVPASEAFRRHARARVSLIAELRQRASAAGVTLSVNVQHGDPAEIILLHARARRPDLIVLGTHRRTGVDRLRSGSVAEYVSLNTTQPVLIVPEGGSAQPAAGFARVIVAVDFSAASIRGIEQALSLVDGAGSRMTLVHVVAGTTSTAASRYRAPYGATEYQDQLTEEAWHRLQEVVPRELTTAATIHARVAVGNPAEEIVRIAHEIDADLIVVGVTPRGTLSRKVFGATAARVMRAAARPVLAVPERTSRRTSDRDRQSAAA